MRITMKQLELLVERLNDLTNSPLEYTNKETKKANIGHYHLSGAYGGWILYRTCTDGGGVEDILHCGYVPKKELYNLIHAYIRGIELNNAS